MDSYEYKVLEDTVVVDGKTYDLQASDNPFSYRFISSPLDDFIKDLSIALRHVKLEPAPKGDKWCKPRQRVRFLDVGCGVGNILTMAETYYRSFYDTKREKVLEIAGIEHDYRLAQLARESTRRNIEQMDALKFARYGEYDIIHYYRPIKDIGLMMKLEDKIEDEMRVGAVIICRLKADRIKINHDKRFKRLDKRTADWGGNEALIYRKERK